MNRTIAFFLHDFVYMSVGKMYICMSSGQNQREDTGFLATSFFS